MNKHYVLIALLGLISSISYGIFERPVSDRAAYRGPGGMDVDYTDPETGQTYRKFAPVESGFGLRNLFGGEQRPRTYYYEE